MGEELRSRVQGEESHFHILVLAMLSLAIDSVGLS